MSGHQDDQDQSEESRWCREGWNNYRLWVCLNNFIAHYQTHFSTRNPIKPSTTIDEIFTRRRNLYWTNCCSAIWISYYSVSRTKWQHQVYVLLKIQEGIWKQNLLFNLRGYKSSKTFCTYFTLSEDGEGNTRRRKQYAKLFMDQVTITRKCV